MLHIFLSNYPGDVKYGTIGKPVPGYDVRLVDDHGNLIEEAAVVGWQDEDKLIKAKAIVVRLRQWHPRGGADRFGAPR
jgi:acyl-coenzyme A synthetase/AMP-(fatty) acid ligase